MTDAPALLDPLMTDPAIGRIMADRGLVERMLTFEAALARAEAYCGVIPAEAAEAIVEAAQIDRVDMAKLAQAAATAGNPAIPFVRMMTDNTRPPGRGYVHWGATSQDVLDTALVLQLRDCMDIFSLNINRLTSALMGLTERHRHTVIVARTLLQHALPTTFGMKAAGWMLALADTRKRLVQMRSRVLVLQFGGAAGTLASLGDKGPAVTASLAGLLDLGITAMPWHTQRDRIAEVACFCGLLVGALGKIARDVSLMTQTEIGELREGHVAGRGGSSTMPHKRNPLSCNVILSAATSIPNLVATVLAAQVQEHERGLGTWAAEWRSVPEIMRLTSGALLQTRTLIEGLEVDVERMKTNLDATGGLIFAEAVMMALAPHTGRLEAHHIVENACQSAISQGVNLQDVLARDERVGMHLDRQALADLFEPANYLGSVDHFIDMALEQAR
jgi:3-carboxy-cis,cis-muconate cycloisomerase